MSNQQFDATTAGTQNPTKDVATDEAKKVAEAAQHGGQNVADTARTEASHLADEAKGQAQDLFHQVRTEAASQVSAQQQRLAGGLRSLSDELDKMANGADSGTASGLVSQAAGQVDQVAGWLDGRDPGDLLQEVRRYARRNPGTFLAGAALLGLIGGRLTRGLQSDARRGQSGGYDRTDRGYRPGPGTAYAQQDYAPQDHGQQGYPQQGYTQQGYVERGHATGAPATAAYGGVTSPDTGLFDQEAHPVPRAEENLQGRPGDPRTAEGRDRQWPEGDIPR
ncbi:hypothetical protein [Mobilicoccus caccae]|uniref:DUF3618 domain-containing protein n=1 Tax=Mobilicoccus caccae TaxID=1859295 RepID=A0ABQ6ISE3_9MICO|nr:hypothetical protein [Mobilicoccus caccae]GMA39976.1 hypothetical protein GCM10025883_20210 [Mobilicoccus caccae]